MNCPNCNRPMNNLVEHHWTMDDSDMEDYFSIVGGECKRCNISFHEDASWGHKKGWNLPKEFTPTDKQVRTVLFIKSRLRFSSVFGNEVDKNPITKKQHCEFISKFFQTAKDTPKQEYDVPWEDEELFSQYFEEEW